MSDSPDPKIVREIARKHLSNFLRKYPMVDAFFVGSVVLEACGDPELWQNDRDAYNAWCSAVVDEIRVALPSWPTEQPQDAHPLDPARKTCLDCGHYFLAHRSDVGCTHCECKAGIAAGHVAEQPQDGVAPYRPLLGDEEFIDILQGGSFYAEVTAFRRLAATIGVEQTYRKWTKLQRRARTDAGRPLNEQPQDDGDVRAVRAVVDAAGKLPIPQFQSMPEMAAALNALLEQFEDRIKVIDEAESLTRLRARITADNGNRTSLAEVLKTHGMTEADLDTRNAKGGGEQ